jgi:hypothetical protein
VVKGVTNVLGKMMSNSAQWVMTVCTANADVMIMSPSVVIALGTVVFVFSMLEAAIEYWGPLEAEEHREHDE